MRDLGHRVNDREASLVGSYGQSRKPNLWQEDVHGKYFLIDLRNITSFPFKERFTSSTSALLKESTAHVHISIESHVQGSEAAEVGNYLCEKGKWACAIAPAEDTAKGSRGGIIVQARKFLTWAPLDESCKITDDTWVWKNLAYVTGIFVQLRSIMFPIFGLYGRNGLSSPETVQALQEVNHFTQGGRVPFLLAGDFNATPQEFEASGWLAKLQAQVVHTGKPTCTKRCIDYIVVSTRLRGLVVDLQQSWAFNIPPHASLRLALSRDKADFLTWAPRVPSRLPDIPVELDEEEADKVWQSCWEKCQPKAWKTNDQYDNVKLWAQQAATDADQYDQRKTINI